MIRSFNSPELERYFIYADPKGLPFCQGSLLDVRRILIDLDSKSFKVNDFELLWTVQHHQEYSSATVTVNGIEPTGAITFRYEGFLVFDVDYFCEG